MYILCTINAVTALFSSRSGTPLLCLTYRTQQCSRMYFRRSMSRKSWRYNFCCKVLQIKKLTRRRSDLLGGKFFLLPWTPMHDNRWYLNGELSFLAQCRSTALVQRISNRSKFQNTILTPDKVLNVLMYGLPYCVIICRRYGPVFYGLN